ncbi:DNA ligase D [Cupriavidus oxalaticus]|uniref:DNA ligase (ATP) n=1 Tax=Cupriavidus oxalaticus TaxID=96344 RepID=A0A375FKP1_9BURK|nr:DNA ligase D [Cupriavidus oxalaticus]QRQ84697.1 DNA ligase D [Cupriavidus oxalaticus]QRQ91214.1 DNA ligase D [Cupriavidus oxalaticus]WQD85771.1 DNA ligase D [Cupriavidus oxalaticus]SPC05021.1 Multifunctional non-homologous end joining protein LigD (Includes: 3'-phosphoesterase; DNA ligase D; DNA repair polymerase) [Cupriavidus oxalaticus]SPC20710.1 Multifunctional non-homologous end joining protein LigD (Includes: 3'-phosphoesterase; DNA ligase D; DNA repair polymerase) [Cupriavidus oxalati
MAKTTRQDSGGSRTAAKRTTARSGSPARKGSPPPARKRSTASAALDKYRRMRDFGATPEPSGAAARTRGAPRKRAGELSFVIQKHAARRLHYDFRLELGGTLKSWAVPKGPSLDPSDKRMAVHVEDHPMDYAGFEGVIPAGHYGAGTVIVWDRGTWVPVGDAEAGYRAGKLKFELRGQKLHGHWTLVRMHGSRQKEKEQDAWLLIKERDAAAVPAAEFDVVEALPDSVLGGTARKAKGAGRSARPAAKRAGKANPDREADGDAGGAPSAKALKPPPGAPRAALPLALAPQLATLVDKPPADAAAWRYEIKFDGYRVLARIDGKDVRLFTRQGHDWTAKLRALARDVGALGLPDGWLDGEIVVLGKHGETDFQALQNAFDTARVEAIQYFVFDLPFYAGHDLRKVPLAGRRALLRHIFAGNTSPRLQFSEDFEASPGEMLDAACRMKLEGVIGKRADSSYVSARSNTWIKLKCTLRQEFVVAGFTDPRGSRTGIGSLLLGVHDSGGRLRYAGNVGTGFDTRTLGELRAQLDALRADTSPFATVPAGVKGVKGHWVRPKLVAEVSFGSWTREGRVRHAVFHGLRTDKPAGAVSVEMPAAPAGKGKKAAAKTAKKAAAKPPAKRAAGTTALGGKVRISHAERVIDTASGLTKGDLVRYYEQAAPLMLPHLRGRPIAMVRAPAGVGGEQFFQRHGDTLRVDGINILDPSLWPGHPALLEIVSAEALVSAAQLNVVEFHTWNASKRSIDRPNRIIFDLDPGEGVPWNRMQEAAALMKALLDELGLASFLKTSGGKGLHVVVPVTPRAGWDEVKDFAQDVVRHVAATIPQRFVAKSGARNRVGKIFIDYLRNGVGATTVAAFSARARPGLGVSIPVSWEELETLESSAQWTVANAGPRLEALQADDPWAGYAGVRQSITRAAARLGRTG